MLVAFGAISTDSGTYQILNFISWTGFTFLPVLISITAAKKFGMNTFAAVVIACALVSPDYIAMVNSGASISFLGIPVQLLSYTSSVIPIILAVWAASYIEKFFNKILPVVIRYLFSAMLTIAITVPLTLLVIGPVGNAIGGAIGDAYNFLYGLSPIVAGVIVGGLWEVLVIFGVHWGITPVTVGNYTTLGYDTFTGLQASAVFSQAGATLGVLLKTKNKELKNVAASAAVTGIFGITEPAIYGVNLRYKKPMICGCIAGAVGGAIGGAFNAVSWGYNMPGIATIPAYFREGHTTQFVGFIISILVLFVLGAVLTYLFGFKDEKSEESSEKPSAVNNAAADNKTSGSKTVLYAPVSGKVIPVTDVDDEVFSTETLGKGVGIIPDNGKLYAPCDCEIEMLSDTGHALGLNADGVELLIHVGIDTVKLNGEGFRQCVKEGQMVKKGDLLLEFDKELIVKKGYDPVVISIAADLEDDQKVETVITDHIDAGQPVMTVDTEVQVNA